MKTPVAMLQIQNAEDLQKEIHRKQNEFLDLYSLYLKTRILSIREELSLKAYELYLLDPSFSFSLATI